MDGNIKLFDYSMIVLLATIGLTFVTNVDMLIVKHYLSDKEAGYYAAAALLGKIVLFATAPVAMVMFPKATVKDQKNHDGSKLLGNSLLYTGSISFCIVLLFIIAPEFIVKLLFGPEFVEINGLLFYFAAGMALFSLSNTFVFYDLATRKYRFLYVLGAVSAMEVALISLFHDSSLTVARILFALMAILFVGVWFSEKR